ncbi:hypothetical protein [Moorena sp. SIO4E2]|nr:hypothetical protein [Moorena sp. SIO4E2]
MVLNRESGIGNRESGIGNIKSGRIPIIRGRVGSVGRWGDGEMG